MFSSSYRPQHAQGSPNIAEKQGAPFFGKESFNPQASSGPTPFFQTKLSVGQPGDRYEQEADAVADKVVQQNSAGPVVQQKEISSIQRLASSKEEEKLGTNEERIRCDKEIQTKPEIQRKCADCEKEEEGAVQKKEGGGHTAAASAALSSQITNSAGKGQALSRGTLGEMQSSFGTDFSHVNIHTGSDAQQMSDQLGAQAFTHGSDIYFNSGKYNPETSQGKHLLAHELTHVVQQGGPVIQKQETPPTTTFPTPHIAASNAVLNLVNMYQTEHILFDGWNNDCRDNNKNGRSDGGDSAESSATDGSHMRRTYNGFNVEANQRCFGGEGGYVELVNPFTTMQEVKYRVCADVISKAYQDAGVPMNLTRRVHDLVRFFRTSPQCDFWEFSTFPGPFLMGDFICSYSERERHGHAGMVIRNCARGEMPYVIHLPGPSQGIARQRYDPRRTNDLTVERWPVAIRPIYGIGRYHG